MSEIKWYYEDKGKIKGPVTENELIDLIKKGKISYGGMVWKEGLPEWTKIENTELLKYLSEVSPPPLKGEPVDNTIVWLLAFAPIIGLFLEYVIAYIEYGNEILAELAVRSGKFWYATFGLNYILCIIDEWKLKKAGYASKLWYWIILIPIYLYKRARICGHSLAYFITWMVCFFVSILILS